MPDIRSLSFSRFWSISFLLLMAASWLLWTSGQTTQADPAYYPSVAMFAWMTPWEIVSSLAIPYGLMATSGLIVLFGHAQNDQSRKFVRLAWAAIAVLLLVAFAADQHRLQPWAYQTVFYAVFIALLGESRSLPYLRVIAISIYFYSAVGKFDHQFLNTVGQDFLGTILQWVGISLEDWSSRSRVLAAGTFPACELWIAILLVIPRTRMIGGLGAIVMHLSLITTLSPLGMSHSLGVLVWNSVLAVQATLLFVRPTWLANSSESQSPLPTTGFSRAGVVAASCLLFVAVTAPLTERRGLWDHWQAWALYSPHSSRMIVELHSSALSSLPSSVSGAVLADDNQDQWHELDMSRWSLNARGVPVVPQSRYQLGLAIELIRVQGLSHQVRGILLSASDRWTGKREESWLRNAREIEGAASRFWFLPY